MFIPKLHKNRAQATTEIALFGTIMIVIFATLLRYGVIYNAKQETQMYAFRRALDLAKRRHDGAPINGAHQSGNNRKFASASINVMRNIFPPSIYVGSVQESTVSDGSASVLVENEAANFGSSDGPDGLEDTSASYYQVGDEMFLNDTYFEPAYIKVKRKVNKNVPKHPWDGFLDLLDGKLEKDDYKTYQALPYREQEQYTNVTHNNYYEVSETPNQAVSDQLAITVTNTTTVFKPPAYTQGQLAVEMRDWDEDVISVTRIPQGGITDMVVNTDKTFTKERTWNSQK